MAKDNLGNLEPGVGYTLINTGNGFSLQIDSETKSFTNPFKVSTAGKTGNTYHFTVQPGTLNNVTPEVYATADLMTKLPKPKGDFVFNSSTHYCFIYLQAGKATASATFPSTNANEAGYPMVKAFNSQQIATDSLGFILLAAAYQDPQTKQITVWNYVTGSLWGDRIKVGSNVAQYFFARV
jgi:hypothetical protein